MLNVSHLEFESHFTLCERMSSVTHLASMTNRCKYSLRTNPCIIRKLLRKYAYSLVLN